MASCRCPLTRLSLEYAHSAAWISNCPCASQSLHRSLAFLSGPEVSFLWPFFTRPGWWHVLRSGSLFQLPRGGCARYTASAFRASFVHCLGVDKAAIHLLIRRQLNRNIASQTRRDLTGCGPNLSRVSGPCVPVPNNKFHWTNSINAIAQLLNCLKQACSPRIHVQQGTIYVDGLHVSPAVVPQVVAALHEAKVLEGAALWRESSHVSYST